MRKGIALIVLALALVGVSSAQGAQWYSNHVPVTAPKEVLGWHKLTLKTKLFTVTCATEYGGRIMPGGEGTVDAFSAYNCVSEGCESLGGKPEFTTDALPWATRLEESNGVVRVQVGAEYLQPGDIGLTMVCKGVNVQPTVIEGQLRPKVRAGTLIGSSPARFEFGSEAGFLDVNGTPEGQVLGSMSIMGYNEGEIISVGP